MDKVTRLFLPATASSVAVIVWKGDAIVHRELLTGSRMLDVIQMLDEAMAQNPPHLGPGNVLQSPNPELVDIVVNYPDGHARTFSSMPGLPAALWDESDRIPVWPTAKLASWEKSGWINGQQIGKFVSFTLHSPMGSRQMKFDHPEGNTVRFDVPPTQTGSGLAMTMP